MDSWPFLLLIAMLSITLPTLSPHLLAADIDPLKLEEALSAYLKELGLHIAANYSPFSDPMEYLEATDLQQKVIDFSDVYFQLTPVEITLDDESDRMEDPEDQSEGESGFDFDPF